MRVVTFIVMSVVSLGAAKAPTTKPAKPPETFTSRAEKAFHSGSAPTRGRTTRSSNNSAYAKQAVAHAKEIDAAIKKELASNNVDAKIAEAMWAGKPEVGMTESQMKLFGSLKEKGAVKGVQTYELAPWSPYPVVAGTFPTTYSVTVRDGKVEKWEDVTRELNEAARHRRPVDSTLR